MSRTNYSTNVASPVVCRITYRAQAKNFSVWNSQTEESSEIDTLEMIVLDSADSISGWHSDNDEKIFSNMVKSISEYELTVKTRSGVVAQGMYSDIKEKVRGCGGKYCSNVFALVKIAGEWVLSRVEFTGTALSSYIEFVKGISKKDLYSHEIHVKEYESAKKGSVKFNKPVFSLSELSPEDDEFANEVNTEFIEPYLSSVCSGE